MWRCEEKGGIKDACLLLCTLLTKGNTALCSARMVRILRIPKRWPSKWGSTLYYLLMENSLTRANLLFWGTQKKRKCHWWVKEAAQSRYTLERFCSMDQAQQSHYVRFKGLVGIGVNSNTTKNTNNTARYSSTWKLTKWQTELWYCVVYAKKCPNVAVHELRITWWTKIAGMKDLTNESLHLGERESSNFQNCSWVVFELQLGCVWTVRGALLTFS